MKKYFRLFITSLLLISIAVHFKDFFFGGQTILTDDFNYAISRPWFLNWAKLDGSWNDSTMLGTSEQVIINPSFLVQFFLPPLISTNVVFIIFILFCFFSGYYLFKTIGLSDIPAIFSALLFTSSPLFLTFVSTGHLGKLYLTPFIALVVAQLHRVILFPEDNKKHFVLHVVLLAVFLSFSFLTTAYQTALYFYMFLPLLALALMLSKKNTLKQPRTLISLGIAVILSIGLSTHATNEALKLTNLDHVEVEIIGADRKNALDERLKWDWATQWSFPPGEMIDFLVPGVMGYSTFFKELPYWGEIGRTPGYTGKDWDDRLAPFANYSGTNHYLGLIALFFFFFTFWALKDLNPRIKKPYLLATWGAICLITLLLSFGRHFPLYEFFYSIPLMDKMRNPNKFLQVFHLAFFVIAAFGVQTFYDQLKKLSELNPLGQSNRLEDKQKQEYKENFYSLLFSIGTFFAIALISVGAMYFYIENNRDTLMPKLFDLLGNQITIIALENALSALRTGAILILSISVLLGLIVVKGSLNKRTIIISMALLALIVTIDNSRVNDHYFFFENSDDIINRSPVTEVLNKGKEDSNSRSFIVNNNSFTDYILWKLALYSGEPFLNNRVTRTLPLAFYEFYPHIYANNFAGLRMANVEILLNTKADRHPFLRPLGALKNKQAGTEVHFYQLSKHLPRVYTAGEIVFLNDKQALFKRMKELDYDPANQVLSHDPKGMAKDIWSDFASSGSDNSSGGSNDSNSNKKISIEKANARIVDFSPEKIVVELEKNRTSDALLVLANHYHPNWKAFPDNASHGEKKLSSFFSWRTKKELKHFPINFLLNGYRIPKDVNRIVLSFSPPYLWGFHIITLLNYLLLLAVIFYLLQKRNLSSFFFPPKSQEK